MCAVISLGAILGTSRLYAQAPGRPSPKAAVARKITSIKSFRIIQEKDGQAVEILSSGPLVPSVQAITDPDRLVIDLPNAQLDTQQKRIDVQADRIKAIRADQFQQNPPVARVVVDLLAPRVYNWDAAGNRIVVHLGKNPDADSSPFQAPTVVSLSADRQPVVTAIRAAGPLAIVGDPSLGSSITAGPDTAVVRLSSGGELHVCPGTTVAITPSRSRHNLLLSMNAGALEAHFALDASSDAVMTPDFRITLLGPGEFHYAISADNRGDTCVRALPGNTASAIVSELLGDRTYQVRATDQLVFRSGQLDRVDMAVPLECGCPPPHETPSRAANELPRQNATQAAQPTLNSRSTVVGTTARVENAPSTRAATADQPRDTSTAPTELYVQVEAPLVFHATGPPPAPAPVEDVSGLPLDSRAAREPAPPAPPVNQPPQLAGAEMASAKPAPSRGFFRKIGGFFASLFR